MKAVPKRAAFRFCNGEDFVVVLILSCYPTHSPIMALYAKKSEFANILLAKVLDITNIKCTFVLQNCSE